MNIYGVTFKEKGKIYFFDAHDLKLKEKDVVIVETEKGLQYGKVIKKISANLLKNESYKSIIRVANKDDEIQYHKNLKDADRALKNAQKIANELDLDMKFLDANYTFDRKQLLFNFLADNRVDFRELAKKLASIYKTRIELRQIGIRDKAKEVGGVGQCGKELCCASFLNHMDAVTINMAKNQNIALNPNKINGVCGRLLCCLAYEDEHYKACRAGMPDIGEKLKINDKEGTVVSVDILNRKYKVEVDGDKKEISLDGDIK